MLLKRAYSFLFSRLDMQLLSHDQDPLIAALMYLKELLLDIKDLPPIRAGSHRIVHGGSEFFQPILTLS
ncbi:hypothetical protein [Polynucleobacter necessarius]|uniref:hypothetical protein n=1 Tax=Polynucleobacter necessarius TaxID=576610 RepID=UPI001E3FCEFA|nr:hypothetical protein [Polynucleobacter necessarius]